MKLRTVPILLALIPASVAFAQDDGLLDRFEECMVEESGAPLDDATRGALAESVAAVSEALGDFDGADSVECPALAAAWAGALGLAPPPVDPTTLPEWALAFGDAIAGRITVCFEAETGAAPSDADEAAIDGYRVQLGSALVQVVDAMGCEVVEDAMDACIASLHAMPCDGLATGLFAGPESLAGGSSDACGTMFDCDFGIDDEALDALFEQEIGGPNGGR